MSQTSGTRHGADLRLAQFILIGSAGVSMPEQQPCDAANVAGDYTMRALREALSLALSSSGAE